MPGRQGDVNRLTSEDQMLQDYLDGRLNFETRLEYVRPNRGEEEDCDNPVPQNMIGEYVLANAYRVVTADATLAEQFVLNKKPIPFFCAAGPRARLTFKPKSVRAAIVTAGGLAPGLHSAIHAIVRRHLDVYKLDRESHGFLVGVHGSFPGIGAVTVCEDLEYHLTEGWLHLGGCRLGNIRGDRKAETPEAAATRIRGWMTQENIKILYVLGGDGSASLAHAIAKAVPNRSVAFLPKTMDNDILWAESTFGHDTAVEQAAWLINTLHQEAEATRRVCVIELFGAESGFVAAKAALASGQCDLVLIPEVFGALTTQASCQSYMDACIGRIEQQLDEAHSISSLNPPHAIIVVAQGVAKVLAARGLRLWNKDVVDPDSDPDKTECFARQLAGLLKGRIRSHKKAACPLETFYNEPRHHIRAVPANASDQIYCERLGALAVDNALAGYTDFMISRWLGNYVLVPLSLVVAGQKSVNPNSSFWRQVANSTGQPPHD